MARETDDRLLAVLGEAAAVVDLDVEGVHPHLGVDLSGFEMPLVTWIASEPSSSRRSCTRTPR